MLSFIIDSLHYFVITAYIFHDKPLQKPELLPSFFLIIIDHLFTMD